MTTIITKGLSSKLKTIYNLSLPTSNKLFQLGVDEVARGCFVGPVVSACVILDIPYLQSLSKRNLYFSEAFKNCCFPKPDSKFEETLRTFDQNLFSLLSVYSQKLLRVILSLSFKILP